MFYRPGSPPSPRVCTSVQTDLKSNGSNILLRPSAILVAFHNVANNFLSSAARVFTKVSRQSVLQGHQISMSRNSAPEECQVRVSLHECPENVSSKSKSVSSQGVSQVCPLENVTMLFLSVHICVSNQARGFQFFVNFTLVILAFQKGRLVRRVFAGDLCKLSIFMYSRIHTYIHVPFCFWGVLGFAVCVFVCVCKCVCVEHL